MGKSHCDIYPRVNGESSKLYMKLLEKIKDRQLTNLIYAYYLQPGVDAQMNNQGFKVNSQGQHNADAVMQFFNVASMQNNIGKVNDIAISIGAKNSSGDYIDFTDSKDALQRAAQSNSTNIGTVSYVVRHGDVFNIITELKDSRTQIRSYEVERNLARWSIIEQAFRRVGIDLNSFDFNRALVNAVYAKEFLEWIINNKNTRNDLFSLKEIRTLLAMDENSSQVQRLKQMFGTLDDVANKIYDAFHRGRQNYTKDQLTLMNTAIDNCKNVQGLDLAALKQQVDQSDNTMSTSKEEIAVQDTLEDLNQKYSIDINEIDRQGTDIKKLSHAASDAAFTLQRQIRRIQAEHGVTPEARHLQTIVNNLIREVANKRYYSGVMNFLVVALKQVQEMESLFQRANMVPGTNLERSIARAKALREIKNIQDGYENIVTALSRIDNLIIDEAISDADKTTIKNTAETVRKYFEKYNDRIKELKETTMIDIATSYLGNSNYNGEAIANIVKMAEEDSSFWDQLYSVSRVSNPLVATMGEIIRDSQGERTKKLNEISLRIRRATNRLYKYTKDTSFMYEPDSNYIISDIDWVKYERNKKEVINGFLRRGLIGLDLAEAIDLWEEANTEDRIVDYVSGRTERVPNSNYRKAFPTLTQEQMEYYNEMMQIKGELGTLLPKYAQKQYLPPQKRRTFTDAFLASKGNPKAIAKAILNKFKDLFIVREDDPLNADNGIILDGEEYGVSNGALDNTPYRRIPIFYINKLKDQDELLKDFSGALQSLAGVAINYECMNKIKDTVEFMGDFIRDQEVAAEKGDKKQVDIIQNKAVRLIKRLVAYTDSTNTSAIVQGFIDKHIYGVKLKNVGKWTKLGQTLLSYTSLRSLAVNVKGMISNYLVGELQMLIEAGAGEFYDPIDYMWAHVQVFGDNTLSAPGRIMDFMTNNVNSMSVLLSQRFDPINEQFSEQSNQRYYGPLRSLLSRDYSFIGYGMGEHMIHFVTMYAILHNIKVKIDGKDATLYDAFYKGDKVDGSSELLLKDNVTYKDSEGNWIPVDDTFLDSVRDRIRYCNQTAHGSMNEEDKGLIHQRMVGRFVMNLRQWMVEHYSRRYRGRHWDASLKEWREGYYNTVGKFMLSWANDIFNFESKAALHWNEMDAGQKANIRRAIAEQLLIGCLLGLSFALGEPEDHKKEFWYRMWIYQTKRALMDLNASTPISAKGLGIPQELTKMINSPIAATNTVNALMYPFVGLPDINKTVKSGRYRGWNKYGRNLMKYDLPFYNHIDQLQHMGEDESVFAVFENNMR